MPSIIARRRSFAQVAQERRDTTITTEKELLDERFRESLRHRLWAVAAVAFAKGDADTPAAKSKINITYMAWYNTTQSEGQQVQAKIDVFNYRNEVLGPLLYISRNDQNTISQALANFRAGFGTDCRAIMAACAKSVMPSIVLYFFGQKYFIESIVLSGMKL